MLSKAIIIERFEHIDTRQGLSQNNVLCMFCDSKGFLWFGTMDGLNRYDGYNFKVFKSVEGQENTLTHNRISKIWEDSLNYIWVETYEGYYHYYNPEDESFTTFPNYLKSLEEKNSILNSFYQSSNDEIWLGSSNSGAYFLKYDPEMRIYKSKQYLSRGVSSISNNSVNSIIKDQDENIWIGTNRGLNFIQKENLMNNEASFKHFYANLYFTSAIKSKYLIYFGTRNGGIIIYDQQTKSFIDCPKSLTSLGGINIRNLDKYNDGNIIISTTDHGLFLYNREKDELIQFDLQGKSVNSVYIDKKKMIWVITDQFGITKVNPILGTSKHYTLTPEELKPLVDNERLYLYEDHEEEFWIGTHGAGLALYDRLNDRFVFYRNVPNMPGTISSNFVHCIAEDKSGLLWVGTGQINGGINKIVKASSAFNQIIPKPEMEQLSDNVVRSIFQDRNGSIWLSTKSGEIYIYNSNLVLISVLKNITTGSRKLPGYNIYSIIEDDEGYIWMGSKGGGVLVSKKPITDRNLKYSDMQFIHYQNDENDSNSLSSNFVYSILQDKEKKIWISTYGGGINKLIRRVNNTLYCQRFNTGNSGLSSDEVRYLYEDHKGNIWIGTTFGLNLLPPEEKNKTSPVFTSFLFNPQNPKSISNNDVIHIFEDSNQKLWLGTFGGGLNLLDKDTAGLFSFKHFNTGNGLINDAVFAILEDEKGKIWLSTGKGMSLFNPEEESFENYDKNSGLFDENFSENTCFKTKKNNLLFGSLNGMLIVYPERIEKSEYKPPVFITNFQLSNRDVNIKDPESPINVNIETLNKISLHYFQSSFSFEYTALSYYAPNLNKYKFILENFDNDWNIVGNQRKATYTNIPPGKYVFKVTGASWDGTWNDEPVSLQIRIFPPWWKSKLAYLVYFILSIGLLILARRILLNYYRLHNELLIERRVNEIKLQFFTNISHEIRTPLTLILGPIEDIKSIKRIPAQLLERIEIMERNAKRMLRLVNQLLDFRKIQKEKMSIVIQKTDLIKFTQEIAEHFKPIIKQKKINFNFLCNYDILPVYIDLRKFDSVVFNILSNAFKYSPVEGEVKLEIIKENDEFVHIVVSDEGPGIPKDKQNILFQRFTTLNEGNEAFEGSGIGLNLSYEIMKLHKGTILAKNNPEKGSTFTIKLPLGKDHFQIGDFAKEEFSHIKHQEIIEEFGEDDLILDNEKEEKEKKKVLIVEDNFEIIYYLKNILKNEFEIKSIANGKEGLEKIKEFHPDLIISDVMMPVMDGIEFTRKIKENIETSHIPVIMLTAKSTVEDQIIGVESGAESYILKPFNADLLKAVVHNIVKQRENILAKYSGKKYTDIGEVKVTRKDDEFMQNIVNIIDENYQDPEFNVEKLVEISSVSRTLLYNKLKGLTGLSPVEFIRQMRLKYAAAILKETGRGVSETAYLSGFNDIKYFRKCFKELFGVSPKEYKQN